MDKQKLLKKRKKNRRVFNQGLRNVPKIEPHCYYASDKNAHLKKVDASDVKLDGITYHTTKEQLEDFKGRYLELQSIINEANSTLTGILLRYGYNTPNIELNALTEDILKLNIIEPNVEYIGYKLVDGYVVGYGYDLIMIKGEQPDDFDKGYWKLVNGEWTLDNERFNQIWGG